MDDSLTRDIEKQVAKKLGSSLAKEPKVKPPASVVPPPLPGEPSLPAAGLPPPPLPVDDPFHPGAGLADSAKGGRVRQRNLARTLIKGLAVLVLLVSALAGGIYLVSQQGVGEIREEAAGGWCDADDAGTDYGSPCQVPVGKDCNIYTDCGADGKRTYCGAPGGGGARVCTGTWHATGSCCPQPPIPPAGSFNLRVSGDCIVADNSSGGNVVVRGSCFICSGPADGGCSDISADFLRSCPGGGDVTVSNGSTGQQIICSPGLNQCENFQIDAYTPYIQPPISNAIVGEHSTQGGACQVVPPEADFSSICTPSQTYGNLSYDLKVDNISGSGGFEWATFFLSFPPGKHIQAIYDFLGTSTWEGGGFVPGSDWYGYWLDRQQVIESGEVNLTWDRSLVIGDKGNQRTIDELASWAEINLPAGYTFSVDANIRMGGLQNDSLGPGEVKIFPGACAPTADFSAVCTPGQQYGALSYRLTTDNIQGQGDYDFTTFFLSFPPGKHRDDIRSYLGTSTWEGYPGFIPGQDWYGYYIYRGFQLDAGGRVVFDWDTASMVRLGSNQRSIDDLADWVAAGIDVGTFPSDYQFVIGANASMGGVQNDDIGSESVFVKPDACVQIVSQCMDLETQIWRDALGWLPVPEEPDNNLSTVGLPGDLVRFVARGSFNFGSFSEGAFFVNGGLYRSPDVFQIDATHFALEYTLTGGPLDVGAVLFHDSLGWVD